MNELFEEMKNDYEKFCRSAQRFMNAYQAQFYKSWIGKVVYVWDETPENKQKAVLLDCNPKLPFPFRIAGTSFKHAELCED